MRPIVAIAVLLLWAGCVGADKDPNCRWPSEHQGRALDLTSRSDRRHLADDAQTAEDLAIRHADESRGPDWQSNVAEYHRVREECRARLNLIVAQQHLVTVNAVAAAVSDRRVWLDVVVVAAFAGLFLAIAAIATSFMLRGALVDSRVLAGAMLIVASLAAGVVAVLGSTVFVGVIESLRIGNGHMSYRAERLPLRHRRIETFAAGAACFVITGAVQLRRKRGN